MTKKIDGKNVLALPTWIMAITSVISLLVGIIGTRTFDQKKFDEYEKTIEYLKIPGQNPKMFNDFEFKLVDLTFIERTITVDLLITSKETSKKLDINDKTRLIDNFGNVYLPKTMKLGAKTKSWNVSDTLPADIGIAAQFTFENINSKATGIKLLEVYIRKGNVSFTNDDFVQLNNVLKPE